MVVIKPGFLNTEERSAMLACVKRHDEDHGIARRANALLLLDDGKSCATVSEMLFIDADTARSWWKQYVLEGWEQVAYSAWRGGQSRLTCEQEADLTTWLEDRFCLNTVPIVTHIHKSYGVTYSHSGCLKLLARLGFEYRKPKALSKVADEQKQAEFIAKYEALMNALDEDEAVYFADAVHPEHQVRPAYGWVRKGSKPAIKTNTGRGGRVNIHGALNLENFDTPFIEATTVDGKSAVQFLNKIQERNPDRKRIHVIWDNAAYHKGPDVRAFLSRPDCRIHLIQLPPYCPHLNPIERLWAVLHEHVTHNRVYETKHQFADAILTFLRDTIPKQWRNFCDKVSDNFKIISNQDYRILEG